MSSILTKVNVYQNGRFVPQNVQVENGKIVSIRPCDFFLPSAANTDGHAYFLIPRLIDLHLHGMGGFGPEKGAESLLQMSAVLADQHVQAFCPTLYAAAPDVLEKQLAELAPVIGQETGARILGFHLEGPFLSPDKKGVMKPQDLCAPDEKIFKRFYQAAQGKIAALTLAPELPNIQPVIDFCRTHNILVQAGHTNATYHEIEQARAQGIFHVTHFGNAMRGFHHREPGVVGAVLMDDFSCEMIADGLHVLPEVICFLRRVKGVHKLVLVTDALLPTGQKNGPFYANGEEVFLENNVWKRTSDRTIAGSSLTMLKGIQNLVSWGFLLEEAVQAAVDNPARLVNLKNAAQVSPTNALLVDKTAHPIFL